MRLTLRTMLAYLDGILEPSDAQDIGAKIDESEYAAGLVHRIRDVMRRLRLGAPSLTDRNARLDPNEVAEYLDNTLPSEKVSDFEKVCLDSDPHLAEVAACHQILTLVLGEPAEIDPVSRQRMYQLRESAGGVTPPPLVAPPQSLPPQLDMGPTESELSDRRRRMRPTVPEYLRESGRRRPWASYVAIAGVVVVLTIAVLMALGQFEPGTPLGDLLARSKVSEPEQPPEAESESPLAVEPAPDQPSAEVESAPGPAVEPQQPALSPEAAPSQPAQAVEKPAVQEPPAAAPAEPSTPPTDAGPAVETAKTAPPAVAATDRPPEATAVEPAVEPAKTPEATDSLPPEPLGRLMSTDQVLLKHDATAGWTRAAPNEMLTPQRLLCLPTYRAKVALTVGVSLEILGGTRLDLLPSSPQDLPGVRIEYGRVVLMPLAQAGSRVRVAFGDRSGVVTFSDAASIASFEVRRLHPPGADPEASPPHIVADLFCTSGGLSWEETGKTEGPLELKPPQRISFDADLTSAPFAPKEMPKWIEAEPISQLDRKASAAIAQPQALPTDRPARLALLELFTTRPQKEVKWLALRCLSHIGQFADMTAVLNDPDQKLDWSKYVDQLREAVSRDAESAAAVRLALEKQYPQQAAQLYRMLWGYDNKDLEAGADAELVKALADDMLAVRVLSHWNLKDLTGLGLFYRPEQTAALRQQPIRRWKERLDAGEIRLKNTEEKAGAADNVSPPEN